MPPAAAPRLMSAARQQPVPAGPQEFRGPTRQPGYYTSVNVGFGFQEDATNSGSFIDLESNSDIGFGIAGAVGYGWPGGLRVEGELAYRQYGLDSLTITRIGNITGLSIGGFSADGDVSAFTLMANVAYDFELGLPFKPFLTGGVGTALIDVNDVKALGVDIADDSDWVGALQFGGGAVFAFRDRLSLVASYRYLVTTDPELKDSAGDSFDSEFASHNIQFGIRYAL
jgi:opacity protein-like surface antigen